MNAETTSRASVVDSVEMELPSSGLLSFYDGLRERLTSAAERRGGKGARGIAEILLVGPDLFFLLARLSLDRRVPAETRRLLIGALAYFLTPVDLLPEALLGPGGFLEDIVLAAVVLSLALDPNLEPVGERYWRGSQRLRDVLRGVAEIAYEVLGERVYLRLRRLVARWGITL